MFTILVTLFVAVPTLWVTAKWLNRMITVRPLTRVIWSFLLAWGALWITINPISFGQILAGAILGIIIGVVAGFDTQTYIDADYHGKPFWVRFEKDLEWFSEVRLSKIVIKRLATALRFLKTKPCLTALLVMAPLTWWNHWGWQWAFLPCGLIFFLRLVWRVKLIQKALTFLFALDVPWYVKYQGRKMQEIPVGSGPYDGPWQDQRTKIRLHPGTGPVVSWIPHWSENLIRPVWFLYAGVIVMEGLGLCFQEMMTLQVLIAVVVAILAGLGLIRAIFKKAVGLAAKIWSKIPLLGKLAPEAKEEKGKSKFPVLFLIAGLIIAEMAFPQVVLIIALVGMIHMYITELVRWNEVYTLCSDSVIRKFSPHWPDPRPRLHTIIDLKKVNDVDEEESTFDAILGRANIVATLEGGGGEEAVSMIPWPELMGRVFQFACSPDRGIGCIPPGYFIGWHHMGNDEFWIELWSSLGHIFDKAKKSWDWVDPSVEEWGSQYHDLNQEYPTSHWSDRKSKDMKKSPDKTWFLVEDIFRAWERWQMYVDSGMTPERAHLVVLSRHPWMKEWTKDCWAGKALSPLSQDREDLWKDLRRARSKFGSFTTPGPGAAILRKGG